MKKINKNRGITLVALVITIIILLILAGVAIASLTENGLFEKAKLAKEKQKQAQERENNILSEYEEMISQSSRKDNDNDSNIKYVHLKVKQKTEDTITVIVDEKDTNNIIKIEYYLNDKLVHSGNEIEYVFRNLTLNTQYRIYAKAEFDNNAFEISTSIIKSDYSIPNLTSNKTTIENETYIVTASSYIDTRYPYCAFDGVFKNGDYGCWHSSPSSTNPWLQIQFPTLIKIEKFSITNRENGGANIKNFIFQGSLNGTDWEDIGEYTNSETDSFTTVFNVSNPDYYLYYRWYSKDTDYCVIGEITLNNAYRIK